MKGGKTTKGLKLVGASVALALGSMNAMAAPIPAEGLFLSLRDFTNNVTFVVNLGVTSSDFLANNANSSYVLGGSGQSTLSSWLSTADRGNTYWSLQSVMSSPSGGLTTVRELNPFATDTRTGAVNSAHSEINTFVGVQNTQGVLNAADGGQTNDGSWIQDFGNAAMGIESDAFVGSSLDFYQVIAGTRNAQGQINALAGSWTLSFLNGQASLVYETAPVPLPAAVWLLGSGLLGLMGIARRKSA